MSEINSLAAFHAFSSGALLLLGSLLLAGLDRVNIKASRWLGVFYIILACSFTQLFLEGFQIDNNFLIHLLELPRWTLLPCLYMAVTYYVSPFRAKKDWILHFVPFLLFLLFSLVYLIPSIFNEQTRLPVLPIWIIFFIRYFFYVQIVFYWLVCYSLLRDHQRNVRMIASFTEKIDLEWLKYLLISVLFLILIRALSIIEVSVTDYTAILYFVGTILLAYSTLTQKSVYTIQTDQPQEKEETIVKKIVSERLTAEQVEELKNIVMRKTMDEKLYLDPGLTLLALSDKTGISTHELSYTLNNGIGKSFYQYINELRTEEAKILLLSADTKHLDILGVAIRAGFTSKTTFYTTFKKVTNLTPKEYIKANSATD